MRCFWVECEWSRGHTEPVNAVSWNGRGLLASALDDHSVIIWAAAGARQEAGAA